MSTTVRLNDIVEALEMQFDQTPSYLDLDTGQVVTVSEDLLRQAEEPGDEEPDLLDWQRDEWEIAKRIGFPLALLALLVPLLIILRRINCADHNSAISHCLAIVKRLFMHPTKANTKRRTSRLES